MRIRRISLVLTLVALVALTYPASAHAHAALVASEPATSSTVDRLEQVVLRFDSPVVPGGSHLWLQDDSGVVPLTATHLDGDRSALVATVPPVASAAYILGYHVLAADGDPIVGELPFTLDAPAVGGAPVDPIATAPTGVSPTRAVLDAPPAAVGAPSATDRMPLLAAVAGAVLLTGLALGVIRPLRKKELHPWTS